MAKVSLDLTEMYNADVKFISLVKRGANKIPFRIIKSEDGLMGKKLFNLETLFSAKKTEVIVPAIVGFAVAKSDKTAGFVEALEQKGYKFTQEDVDGGVICTLKSVDPEAVTTLKVSDDVAVMLEGVTKSFYGFSESTDFTEQMSTGGFFSSLYIAMDVLGDTVCNAMYTADDVAPVEVIRKAFQDAQNYVTALVSAIPVDCFKLEKLEPVVKAAPPADGVGFDEGAVCKTTKEEGESVEKATSKTCPECGATCAADATTCKSCGASLSVKKEDVSAPVEEIPPVATDVVKTVTDMIATLTAALTAKMDEGFTAIQKTADEAKSIAQKSDEVLSHVLIGSTAPGMESVQKQASETTKAVFDDVLKFDGFEDK